LRLIKLWRPNSLKQITVITGASRGIGATTARVCAAAGHDVCVVYKAAKDEALSVVADIEAAGRRGIAVQADTGVESDVVRLFNTVDAELGVLTGLVNNAGVIGPHGRLDGLTQDDIMKVLAVNVAGLFTCSREAVKRMSTAQGGAGGAIVNVSSGSATRGNPGVGILYAASKGAVNSLGIGLSQEVAGEGIRVNTVAPGLTETDMAAPERIAREGPTIPMGRVAQPEEIAEAIVWLLSPKASYVAGANLRVGGGRP
jgi:NAD(P)-dependent dehydrogenase (short-subunit alcohol dehydrogenase family)